MAIFDRKYEVDLKPCPFCGSETITIDSNGLAIWAHCVRCGCRSGLRKTEQEAKRAWNRRENPGVCKHEDRGNAEQKESICWDCANSSTSVTDDFADCLCKKRGGIVGGVTECRDYRCWKEATDDQR